MEQHNSISTTWSTVYPTLLLLISLSLLINLLRRPRGRLNLPPGPRPWPIIGNLHLMGVRHHRSVHSLALKYGPLMQLHFGCHPVVVASSPDMAKEILKTHDQYMISRPITTSGKYMAYDYSNLSLATDGPYWREARKVMATEIFSHRRLESFLHIRVEETMGLMARLFANAGRPVSLEHHLVVVNVNTISRMVLGRTVAEVVETMPWPFTFEEFEEMVHEWFVLMGAHNVGDHIPWLNWLDLQGFVRRMKANGEKFSRFMEYVVSEREAKRRSLGDKYVSPQDMVDVLLDASNNPNAEVKFSRDSVKAFTQDLILGGTDSSKITVEWAMSELMKNPQALDKTMEELDRVVGKERWVTEKDIPNLPYMDAVIKETIRARPVSYFLPIHMSTQDCKIAGYDIQGGTWAIVNLGTMAKDPNVWDSPEEYRPERFIGKAIDVKGRSFELLPFGSGRRMCPGYSLGLKMVQLPLACLLQGFSWEMPEGMSKEELDMEEANGLSQPRLVPLVLVPQPRLAPSMYQVTN